MVTGIDRFVSPRKNWFSYDDIFVQLDSSVVVNSITYREYLLQKNNYFTQSDVLGFAPRYLLSTDKFIPTPQDGALSCEYDRDYDCEAWVDYSGAYKSYIIALQNQVYSYEWGYTLTQADIDSINLASRIEYNFAVGVITYSPAARFVSTVSSGLRYVTKRKMISLLISAGIANVVINEIFNGPQSTKLKVGDVVMFKGGKLVSVAREGVIYHASSIMGPIVNAGVGSGGSGEGYPEGSQLRGGQTIKIPSIRYSYCYRTFSNGQVIQVPCP